MIYVRCINCSYNNVAKGIRLLEEKAFLFIQEIFMQVRAFERYISLITGEGPLQKGKIGNKRWICNFHS